MGVGDVRKGMSDSYCPKCTAHHHVSEASLGIGNPETLRNQVSEAEDSKAL